MKFYKLIFLLFMKDMQTDQLLRVIPCKSVYSQGISFFSTTNSRPL